MGFDLPRKQDTQALTFRRWCICATLVDLRVARGLSIEEAAKRAHLAPSVIYRAEGGENIPTDRTLRDLLRVYGADAATLNLLLDLRQQPDERGWWQPAGENLPGDYGLYIRCEAHASSLHNYETILIPGLLQTAAYAEAVTRKGKPAMSNAEIRRRVELRMQRQSVFTSPDPAHLHAIIDEAALRRRVGGPDVMQDQLKALLDLPPAVRLQVIPFPSGAHSGMHGGFVVMRFRDVRAPSAIFTENAAGQFIVDADDNLNQYSAIWDDLISEALDPKGSARLIADAAREME